MTEYINRGLLPDSVAGEIICYFQNRQTGKNTLSVVDDNIVKPVCERLRNLSIYCMYNHGLEELSLDDLQYVYSWLI